MFQLCLHRPGTSVCSCSIFAPKAGISPKLATHESLVMHCMSFYFYAISVLAFWVAAVKVFMQLPYIFAHLRILLRTYARRVAYKFALRTLAIRLLMPLLAAALLSFTPCTACLGSPHNATHSASIVNWGEPERAPHQRNCIAQMCVYTRDRPCLRPYTVKGRIKFTTSGAHDVISITSPQKNEEWSLYRRATR